MAFDPKPDLSLIALPLPSTSERTGLQGAHVIGNAEWNSRLSQIFEDLNGEVSGADGDLIPVTSTDAFNGVLLPETEYGSLVLGTASHSGLHVQGKWSKTPGGQAAQRAATSSARLGTLTAPPRREPR